MNFVLAGIYFIFSMIDLYLAISWSKLGIFEEGNNIFRRLLLEKRYGLVAFLKIILTCFVIFICLYFEELAPLLNLGIVIQSIIIGLYIRYKRIFDDEIHKQEGNEKS